MVAVSEMEGAGGGWLEREGRGEGEGEDGRSRSARERLCEVWCACRERGGWGRGTKDVGAMLGENPDRPLIILWPWPWMRGTRRAQHPRTQHGTAFLVVLTFAPATFFLSFFLSFLSATLFCAFCLFFSSSPFFPERNSVFPERNALLRLRDLAMQRWPPRFVPFLSTPGGCEP